VKGSDVVAFRENRAHDLALHPNTSAVNDPNYGPAPPRHFFQVGFYRSFHIARRESVEIKGIFNRKFDRLLFVHRSQPYVNESIYHSGQSKRPWTPTAPLAAILLGLVWPGTFRKRSSWSDMAEVQFGV